MSYNPEAYAVSLDKGWFEFEKYLYGCRLWDGSLQAESQEIEHAMTRRFRDPGGLIERIEEDQSGAGHGWISGIIRASLQGADLQLTLKKEILDLGQFQSLQIGPDSGSRLSKRDLRSPPRQEEPLVLRITLDEEENGVLAGKLRAGDVVSARVIDSRDIARYLARLLGGSSDEGPAPIAARIEAIEAEGAAWWGQSGVESRRKGTSARKAPDNLLVRVRFAPGVCGDASLSRKATLKVLDQSQAREESSWWRRFFT